MSVRRLFVANRGEVAMRIIRACHNSGVEVVLGVSQADVASLPARLADRPITIGGPRSADSYLRQDRLISAALATGCDALHPGYGFLAESAELAAGCREHGVTFVGPQADALETMGQKSRARAVAAEASVPVLPGTPPIAGLDDVPLDEIGYPMLLKAVGGGGGRGIRLVESEDDLAAAFEVSSREADTAFGDGRLYVERFIPNARHLEVQVLGDAHGNVVHLGERECSVQRRHQKVLEESPASISAAERDRLCGHAVRLAAHIGYENAGTVEFVHDPSTGDSWFIEMNTRLQVEHAVTEMVTEVDIVAQQLRIADGQPLPFSQRDVTWSGHAIEWRVTAESPEEGFVPRAGHIERWDAPELPGVRVDTHCFEGYEVPPFYDSLLAKLVAHGATRDEAIDRLARAAERFEVVGVPTTLGLCAEVVRDPGFRDGPVTTQWLDGFMARSYRTERARA